MFGLVVAGASVVVSTLLVFGSVFAGASVSVWFSVLFVIVVVCAFMLINVAVVGPSVVTRLKVVVGDPVFKCFVISVDAVCTLSVAVVSEVLFGSFDAV